MEKDKPEMEPARRGDHPAIATQIVGAALAGGKSRRLGQDKAGLLFNNQTLLARNLALLASVVGDVWISGRQETDLINWKLPDNCHCLPDLQPGQGPLGGLVSLLRQTGCACLVLPVDLPFMRPELLCHLLTARAKRLADQAGAEVASLSACESAKAADLAVTQFVHTTGENNGRQEHLVAIYEQAALTWLEPCLASCKLKLGLAIPEKARHLVSVPAGKEECFLNINTKEDLEKARAIIMTRAAQPGWPETKCQKKTE